MPDTAPGGGAARSPLRPHVVLSGATGFIGRHLQSALAPKAALTAITRPAADGSMRSEIQPNVTQHLGDLTAPDTWRAVLPAADVVISLAGAVRGRRASDFAPANVGAPTALAAALKEQAQAPRVLLVSSLAASQPQLSDYAASKQQGERALRDSGVACDILRPPAVYGPGDTELSGLFNAVRAGFVPRPGPADQRLAFLHVHDLVAAIVAWLEQRPTPFAEPYAIDDGTPNGYSWDDIAAALAPDRRCLTLPVPAALLQGIGRANLLFSRLANYQPMLTPGKARELCYPRWLCNNAPFSAATGWQPQLTLASPPTSETA